MTDLQSPSGAPPLKWSKQLAVLPSSSLTTLRGDKIILPPSALEDLLSASTSYIETTSGPQSAAFDPYNPYSFAAERQARERLTERRQHLPHPLTFRLVNPDNGRVLYSGVREFSAPEGSVKLSAFLRNSLGLVEDEIALAKTNGIPAEEDAENCSFSGLPKLTIHSQQLSKGSFVKLRPLEAGYDTADWKALLERHLRDNFTTLTHGEEIQVPAGDQLFRFLVDGLLPDHEAVSLVDTDLEVDIEPLSEEQAKETLQKLAAKEQTQSGVAGGTSTGGLIGSTAVYDGQVLAGEYVDFEIDASGFKEDLNVELQSLSDENELDLYASLRSSRNRERPRGKCYMLGDISSHKTKSVTIRRSMVDADSAEAVLISVGNQNLNTDQDEARRNPVKFHLSIRTSEDSSSQESEDADMTTHELAADEERCSNCQQVVPKRTMFLHQNFCLRNNVFCPHCRQVFQKTSQAWANHWHCDRDESHGNTKASKVKHDALLHTPQVCSSCGHQAANTPDLAQHRTTSCPGKLILCHFCHLEVPQQGPEDLPADSPEVILSGLTPHEVSDGARTTECHLCDKIVRLRDMTTHLKTHDFQRLSRVKPSICRNALCAHTVDTVARNGNVSHTTAKNDLGLCESCFGPLYVSQYDPEGKALRRRVERKYLTQLLTGCNQPWCRNDFCKTGREHQRQDGESAAITSKDAAVLIRPVLENLQNQKYAGHFCTSESNQQRRILAEILAAEDVDTGQGYDLEWCVAAMGVEEGDLDKARTWLRSFAPTVAESKT